MKLIIDIPEKDWEFIKEADGCRWSIAILDGVINGTPLPKGHGRLVDADKIKFNSDDFFDCGDAAIAEGVVNEAKTIIKADKGE